jgi:hypothetical protein
VSFEKNVFINCPFDDKYLPLLRPLLFTIIYLGFSPRIALESLDSGEPRFQKIVSLIEESKYAIHDLSRISAERKGEYYRLNMPFEIGLDVGCRLFGKGQWATKRCLILETQRYRYQAAISDLSNSDIAVHNDDPESVTAEVRNWLNNAAGLNAPGPSAIWGAFLEFVAANYVALRGRGFSDRDIELLPINELISCMQSWVASAGATTAES